MVLLKCACDSANFDLRTCWPWLDHHPYIKMSAEAGLAVVQICSLYTRCLLRWY